MCNYSSPKVNSFVELPLGAVTAVNLFRSVFVFYLVNHCFLLIKSRKGNLNDGRGLNFFFDTTRGPHSIAYLPKCNKTAFLKRCLFLD